MEVLTAAERTNLVEMLMKQTEALGSLAGGLLMKGMPQDLVDLVQLTGVRRVDIENIVSVVTSATAEQADNSLPVVSLIKQAISLAPATTYAADLRRLNELLLTRKAAGRAAHPEQMIDIPAAGTLVERAHAAILASFTYSELRRVLAFRLDQNLDTLVPQAANYSDQIFELLQSMRRNGELPTLLRCLAQERPRNAELVALFAEVR